MLAIQDIQSSRITRVRQNNTGRGKGNTRIHKTGGTNRPEAPTETNSSRQADHRQTLTLDPGGLLAGLEVAGLLSFHATGIHRDDTGCEDS